VVKPFLDKDDFAAYLVTLPADHTFVRVPGKLWSQCCPLASWLKTCGYSEPRVGLSVWTPDGNEIPTGLPEWAARYVRRVDKHDHDGLPQVSTHFTGVTLKVALDALDGL